MHRLVNFITEYKNAVEEKIYKMEEIHKIDDDLLQVQNNPVESSDECFILENELYD